MIDLKTPQEIYEHIKKYPDIIDDLKIWQLKMALDYSISIDEAIASRLFNFPDKVMQDDKIAKIVQDKFHNDSEKQLNDKMNKLIRHKLTLMNSRITVNEKHQKTEENETFKEFDIPKSVRGFLKYLHYERFIPTAVYGKQIGYTRREHLSILDMDEFIKEKTGHDLNKLHQLRRDVQTYVSSLETDAWLKNEEIKVTSQDEFFLAERDFWKREYEKAINELSNIGKLRVQILQRWIDEKKVSDDKFDLREQFNDDVVDAVEARQAYDKLVPGEGEHNPDTSNLNSFLLMIDNEIQKAENWNNEKSSGTENAQQLYNDLKLLNSEFQRTKRILYTSDYFQKFERLVTDELVSDSTIYNSPISIRLKEKLKETITLLKDEDQNSEAGKIYVKCDRILQFAFDEIQEAENGAKEFNPLDLLNASTTHIIETIAKQYGDDRRSKFDYNFYKTYLAIYKACPELNTRKSRINKTQSLLKGESASIFKKASDSKVRTWEKWIDDLLK